ncbi:MAG: N-acetylornithine carbamoyltransferase [Bacteroidota bacterium]|nr:N-acetylornithine carbamoyltransferase [Bacteroidota bacterium]
MRHLLDWLDIDEPTWQSCIREAHRFADHRSLHADKFVGKALGLVFFNDSLRTRVSMELAAAELGAKPVVVTPGSGTWGFAWEDGVPMTGGEAEHIREAVGVLSRYCHGLGVRLFAEGTDRSLDMGDDKLKTFAAASDVPVLNLESAARHPCQALADASVLHRTFDGNPAGKKFVLHWTSHPKALPMAVPNSTLLMASRLGMDVVVARPDGFGLDEEVMDAARRQAAAHGGSVTETDDADAAADGAHIVYAKAWGGFERYADPAAEEAQRQANKHWRVTSERMARTDQGMFMHCLPVRRGVVVDDAVLDEGPSLHLDQAEYRLHAQKAILSMMWEGGTTNAPSEGGWGS